VSVDADQNRAQAANAAAVDSWLNLKRLDAAVAHRDVQARTNPRAVRRLRRVSRIAGLALVAMGGVVIAAWSAGLNTVTSYAPALTTVKFNTAVGLALIGVSLLALGRNRPRAVVLDGRFAAAVYGLIGLTTVLEYATGTSLWLDNPFGFADAGRAPGRMAPMTAGCFIAMAISVVALGRRRPFLGQFAAVVVTAVGTFGVVGHVFGISALYNVGSYTPVALYSATGFVIAGLAAIFARPNEGFVALITGNTAGGITVRRMLVPALIGPLVAGGLVEAAAGATGPTASGLAAFTIATMLLSGTLVCVIGASLRHVDLRRAGAEDALGEVARALADREVAVELLRFSEERTRRIIETARDAFFSVDERGLVEGWNRAAEETFGWTAEEAIGRSVEELIIPPDERAAYHDQLTRTGSGGRSTVLDQTFERTALRRNGSELPVEMTVWSIDHQGQRTLNAFARDISARKAAEKAIARLVAVVEQSSDAIITLDPGGLVLDWNSGAETIYGYREAEMLGRHAASVLFPTGDLADRDEVQNRLVRGESSFGRQMVLVRADGREITVLVTSSPILDAHGRLVAVSNISHDISDQVAAEAALRSSEERFRSTIENLDESLSVLTAIRDDTGYIVDFRWEFVNSAAVDINGFSAEEQMGHTLMELLPGNGPNGMLEIYRNIVETGEPYVERSLWQEMVWGDGLLHRRAFDIRASKLDDGFVSLRREVTKEREQEDELARQRLELERSNTEMRLLNSLAEMLQSCGTIGDAYSVAQHSCAELFSDFAGSISMVQPTGHMVDLKAQWGARADAISFASADCWALRRGRAHLSGPAGPRCEHLTGTDLPCLCVPMMGPSEALGLIQVAADGPDHSTLDYGPTRRLAIVVAGQLSMAFANLRLRDSLREMSIRDPLTGLFNRRYMEETLNRELSHAARNDTEVGILVIDIDYFKTFNDTHGHEAGDAVLAAVGEVLMRYSRASDVACRLGGEEFILILPNCSLEDAQSLGHKLRQRVSALRVPYQGIELTGPSISCGLAAFPQHGDSSTALIHLADTALYAAKAAGRDQLVVAPS
jgi:diguanylate cyclase (GGDEF)-like protein/PAS domain S-box-containing protein